VTSSQTTPCPVDLHVCEISGGIGHGNMEMQMDERCSVASWTCASASTAMYWYDIMLSVDGRHDQQDEPCSKVIPGDGCKG
jgi:hypothetical protein